MKYYKKKYSRLLFFMSTKCYKLNLKTKHFIMVIFLSSFHMPFIKIWDSSDYTYLVPILV